MGVRRVFRGWAKWLVFGVLVITLIIAGCHDRCQKSQEYLSAASRAWGFRGTVLISYRGNIILAEGYGPANQVFDQLNTPETKFFIGSITKQFTAAAVLKLHEQDRLRLNDPIALYLDGLSPELGQKITIHHLLTHQSGLVNYTDIPEINIRRTKSFSPSQLLSLICEQPLEFQPGTSFKYSNSGYILLGAIIEKVSGQSFEAFLHHEILKPSRMLSSGYARREAAHPGRADGYTVDSDWQPTLALPIDYGILHTAGALYSTVLDMRSWERALSSGGLLSVSSLANMFTDHGDGYGYGWAVEEYRGRRHAFHGGFLDGFNCVVDWWLDDSLFIVVFSNEDEAPVKKIARGLASISFCGKPQVWPIEKTPIPVELAQLARYEGVFHQVQGGHRHVYVEDNALWFQQPHRQRQRLYYEGGGLFFLQSDNTVLLQFQKNSSGQISGYQLLDEGAAIRAERVPDTDGTGHRWPQFRLPIDTTVHDRFIGNYHLQSRLGGEDSILLSISRQGLQLFASVADFERIKIFPVSDIEFVHETVGFKLIFETDPENGRILCRLCMGDQEVSGIKIR